MVRDFSCFSYFDMIKDVSELCQKYCFISSAVIGKSVMGKDIPALFIGEAKEHVLFVGGFHGSEHITSSPLMRFFCELCEAFDRDGVMEGLRVRRALMGRGLAVVPVINPDGCEISRFGSAATGGSRFIKKLCNGDFEHFNANARGVDLNHNFNADWEDLRLREKEAGITGPSRTRFGGTAPESEPETAALCKFCRTTPIRHAIAFHSQGEVIYPPTKPNIPPRSERMAEIMSASSGYALSVPEGLAIGGGFKDWFLREFGRPAFTIEMGKGENPLPLCDYAKTYYRLREFLILSAIM